MDKQREAFEADAAPYGFDLTRHECAAPEPWSEYADDATGHRWAGWQAATEQAQAKIEELEAKSSNVFYDLMRKYEKDRKELALQNQALRSALENHNGNYKLTKSEATEIDKVLNQPNIAADILAEHDAEVREEMLDRFRSKHRDYANEIEREMADELTKATQGEQK